MISREQNILSLERFLNIVNWVLKRDFSSWQANIGIMSADGEKLWETIQSNPQMSEEEFIEIVEALMVE